MAAYKKSQILILSIIAALLFATLFLSASIRSACYYLIVNLLIITLGAEAGLLSSSLKPASLEEEKKPVPVSTTPDYVHNKPRMPPSKEEGDIFTTTRHDKLKKNLENYQTIGNEVMKKLASEKISINPDSGMRSENYQSIKKQSIHSPNIFFVGGGQENIESHYTSIDGEVMVGEISEQEFYKKAEAFIENFYEQLKMQRQQESGNRHQNASKQC